MHYCPNCQADVDAKAQTCTSCGALFGDAGWKPVEHGTQIEPQDAGSSGAGVIVKLGVAAVVIPAIAFAIGLALTNVIPGCRCDEGAGCHGCGANGLVELLLFGGFVGALGALMMVLPASLLLAAIVRLFAGRR